jgi:hypothetical protein
MAERMLFLRNDADTPLLMFMGNRLIPQPYWDYGVAQWDLHKLQPLCDVVWQLLHTGLMGSNLLRTFISHNIQPLQRRVATM